MRTLLLFDLDGTLLNSEKIILTAQARAFAALGMDAPSRERGLSIVGLSLTEAFEVLVGKNGCIACYTPSNHACRKCDVWVCSICCVERGVENIWWCSKCFKNQSVAN